MEARQVTRNGINPEVLRNEVNPKLYGARTDPGNKTKTEAEKNRALSNRKSWRLSGGQG